MEQPGGFQKRRRTIAPYQSLQQPGGDAGDEELQAYSRDKAAALNQHVLGYGDLAEGEWASAGLVAPDLAAMRSYRLERVREQLRRRDLPGILLYDPVNVRYATDSTNMQVWCMHNSVRYAWVATDGPVVLWDFGHCEHLSAHLDLVDEVRTAVSLSYFINGPRNGELTATWAAELADVVRGAAGSGWIRIAADHLDADAVSALAKLGVEVCEGESLMEQARSIKSQDELAAMRRSVAACESAMAVMERAIVPGITENDAWAVLHAENIRRGGEWLETRLLSSGPRTNPWYQESSSRTIRAGDLLAFDTDLIGPYGYCSDVSRTWLVGDGDPTAEQRAIYAMAEEQIDANVALLRPGRGLRELCEEARVLPPDYLPNRYSVLMHGIGLCDEYPAVPYPQDWDAVGYDGELVAGMTICVESYVGRLGGHEGVKLEEQVLITPSGAEPISTYPRDVRLRSSG